MYFIKEEMPSLAVVMCFIEWFLKEMAWGWLVFCHNLSPNWLTYGVEYEFILGNMYI